MVRHTRARGRCPICIRKCARESQLAPEPITTTYSFPREAGCGKCIREWETFGEPKRFASEVLCGEIEVRCSLFGQRHGTVLFHRRNCESTFGVDLGLYPLPRDNP